MYYTSTNIYVIYALQSTRDIVLKITFLKSLLHSYILIMTFRYLRLSVVESVFCDRSKTVSFPADIVLPCSGHVVDWVTSQ